MICTITTSRRPKLFKRTIESARANMRDFSFIQEMAIFDDGSPPEDLDAMKAVAPQFATWEHCDEPQGHVASLNRALEYLRRSGQEFALMAEDDWLFTRFSCPLLASLDVLINNPKVGQVCLGRIDMRFGWRGFTETGTMFTIRDKHFGPDNYPAFTLNPSVVRIEALLAVGEFKAVEGFEREYGERWLAAGWDTSDLFSPHLVHIGDGQSAYDLNGFLR